MKALLLAAALLSTPVVHVVEIEGAINPIKARYVANALLEADRADAACVILRLDSPGGLVDSMDEITKAILGSKRPVVAWVGPAGARAASAAAIIVLASDVAAMAPTTNIGSAHPVAGQGADLPKILDEKMSNDLAAKARNLARRNGRNEAWAEGAVRQSWNATADEALETGVVEFLAADLPALLEALDGRRIENEARSETLAVAGAEVVHVRMSLPETFLDLISNPNVAYVLLSLGTLGIIYEFASPGIGVGGVAGSICLLLGFLSLQALPINLVGLLLLILGVGLLVAEVKVQSHGMLTVGGLAALLFGSFALFDSGEYYGSFAGLSWAVVLPTVGAFGLTSLLLVWLAVRAYRFPVATGVESLVGMRGRMKGAQAHIDGALWEASAEGPSVRDGDEVVVVRVERTPVTRLVVRTLPPGDNRGDSTRH